jgi:hypothetical protein
LVFFEYLLLIGSILNQSSISRPVCFILLIFDEYFFPRFLINVSSFKHTRGYMAHSSGPDKAIVKESDSSSNCSSDSGGNANVEDDDSSIAEAEDADDHEEER